MRTSKKAAAFTFAILSALAIAPLSIINLVRQDAGGDSIGEPFTGHDGAVNVIAFTPPGTAIASGGSDGTVRQWDLNGTVIGVSFNGYEETGNAVAWVPSDDFLWATDGTPNSDPVEGFESDAPPPRQTFPVWLWGLLPLALLALLLWWFNRRSTPLRHPAPVSAHIDADGEEGDRLSPHLSSALALAEAGKKIEALNSLDKAVHDEPTNTLAWIARGNVQNDLNNPNAAIQSFDKALTIQADTPQALVGKGIALTKLGNPNDSLPLFDRAMTAMSQLPDFNIGTVATGGLLLAGAPLAVKALSGKGFALLDAQRPQDALDAFDAALREDSGAVDAIAGRNRALNLLSSVSPSPTPSSPIHSPRTISQAGGAPSTGAAALAAMGGDRNQSAIEAKKFDVGQADLSAEDLADVDQGLPDLPEGYGESRIVLLPRDPQWAYAYWDIPTDHKESLRQQGGETLALRLYDVTNIDLDHQNPHSMQQYTCDELARDWYIPIPVSDRDYIAEIGYVTGSGAWLMLTRSGAIRIPPVYPSDWFHDQFITVNWDDDLQSKRLTTLAPPELAMPGASPIHNQMFGLAQSAESLRIAGSLFGSMQQVPQAAIHSSVFPSGMGLWSASGAALTMSGLGMSGIGMSGVGFSASAPPIRPRRFWLVADAELIVYGATEPDATVTVGDRPIPLTPDGTFRFQMSFQDGEIDFPITAVAADGEQQRSIRLEFERETPNRDTNTKEEATDEWPEV